MIKTKQLLLNSGLMLTGVFLAFALAGNENAVSAGANHALKVKAQPKVLILKTIKDSDEESEESLEGSGKKDVKSLERSKPLMIAAQYKTVHSHKDVQKYLKEYGQAKQSLMKTTSNAKSHLNYISNEVEKRNLPKELALLPMLESNFKLNAVSHAGAVGLWQFMPATGKQYGLKQNASYDGRKDVKASTKAALTYLEYLHKKFNRDWLLALAAYNAGEGTVERAIKRNKSAGKATNFWSLKLPDETKKYVPKFLALTKVLNQAQAR